MLQQVREHTKKGDEKKSIIEVAKSSIVFESEESEIDIDKEIERDLPGQKGLENDIILDYQVN